MVAWLCGWVVGKGNRGWLLRILAGASGVRVVEGKMEGLNGVLCA